MLNLPEVPVYRLVVRRHLHWWSREAELLTDRLNRWMATHRGYSKLRPSRISEASRTMTEDSDEEEESTAPRHFRVVDATVHSNQLMNAKTNKHRCRSKSQPNSPNRKHSAQREPLVNCQNREDQVKTGAPEQDYTKEFRQPYGWTDYTNNNNNAPNDVKQPSKTVQCENITYDENSNEDCNYCCYEFCNGERRASCNCVSRENRKKWGTLEVITNKIAYCKSQANSTCGKYFSFRRHQQVHTGQEDGFLTYRRRRSTKKSPCGRPKKRVVIGGMAENDPMWPAVLLTFDRGVSPTRNMPLTLITSLPETIL